MLSSNKYSLQVMTKGKGSFEHYGDDKTDKERGVMLFKDIQGISWLELSNEQQHRQWQPSNDQKSSHSSYKKDIEANVTSLKFLLLSRSAVWLVRCESQTQKAELQILFSGILPTLVPVERQNFRRVERQAITRRKIAKSRFFVLLSNSFLVEFYDDTLAQIKACTFVYACMVW